MQFLIVLIFVIIAVLLLALSLHFSKYKNRKTACQCAGSEETEEHVPQSRYCPVCGGTRNKENIKNGIDV
jgi:rubredoxin